MKKIFTLLGMCALVSVSAQNLIPNPSFESWTDGTPDGWLTSGSTPVQSTNAHSGTYSLQVKAPATGNNTIRPADDIAVTQGKTYVFSGWYLDNDPNVRFRYWGQFRTATSDTGGNPLQSSDYSADSPEWKYFTAEAQPNATAIVFRAGLRVYSTGTGSGLMLFDDIVFGEKGTLSAIDHSAFEKGVKMNTNVSNELRVFMPVRSTVNIYSTDGKLVKSVRMNDGETIDTSSFAKGMYIVTVDSGTAKTSRKIIKK